MRKLFTYAIMLLGISSHAQNWQLVWSDEFDYSGLPDPAKWGYDTGAGGWGNNELENYTADRTENARVENGTLILEARRDWHDGIEYSSARLVSRDKGDWLYGRIEIKAKIPLGQGLWPAIWMLPTDWEYGGWPASGEVDIMESFALGGIKPTQVEANVHTQAYHHSIGTNKGAAITTLSNIEDNYHVYGVSWFEDYMVFDVDGQEYFTFDNEGTWEAWPFDKRFHLIMNIAVGGSLGTTPDPNIFPKQMTVDYVRVYQENTGPSSSTGLVTAFEHCNGAGFSSGFSVGDYTMSDLETLGIDDDAISSLEIAEGYKVILFMDDNFTGQSVEITSDLNCFDNTWNDQVTSMKVRPNGLTNMAGLYYLQNRSSSIYMDVAGGEAATDDGVTVFQWALTNTLNQQFELEHLGDGSYKVIAKHSGKVLDVDAISTANGADVQQWAYSGTDNQKWIVVDAGNGFYKLIAQHSGKVAEIASCSSDQMANLQQYDNNDQTCGHWNFETVNPLSAQQMNFSDGSLNIYPNPVTDHLHIEGGNESWSIEVYSIDGGLEVSKQFHDGGVSISTLRSGIYTLKVNTGSRIVTQKLVKQ